jgi:hypothetical protein
MHGHMQIVIKRKNSNSISYEIQEIYIPTKPKRCRGTFTFTVGIGQKANIDTTVKKFK